MVKKFLKIILLLFCVHVIIHIIKYNVFIDIKVKSWIKCFEKEDADELFKSFCDDIKDNHSDETLEEIKTAFEFIDGDIVSYKYEGQGSGGAAKDNFVIILYYCYPQFRIETSTGKKYVIDFCYNYIWKKKPEREGIESIRITNYEGESLYSGDSVKVGIGYNHSTLKYSQ